MFGAGGFDFGGLIEALGSLFGGAGEVAGTAAQGIGDAASTAAQGVGDFAGSLGNTFSYPMELAGDALGWMGNNWQPLANYGLQAGQLGLGISNSLGQADAMSQYQRYMAEQQRSMMPQNIAQQATPDRPAGTLAKRTMADTQARGLSGAAPEFLQRMQQQGQDLYGGQF